MGRGPDAGLLSGRRLLEYIRQINTGPLSIRTSRLTAGIGLMDALYLLMLAGLYALTHALVWALDRLRSAP